MKITTNQCSIGAHMILGGGGEEGEREGGGVVTSDYWVPHPLSPYPSGTPC